MSDLRIDFPQVVGVRGSAQMAACKTLPFMTPVRLCQAADIKITMLGDTSLPVQVDGEPWMQTPSIIRIQHKGKVTMLSRDLAFERLVSAWNENQQTQRAATAAAAEESKPAEDVISCLQADVEEVCLYARDGCRRGSHPSLLWIVL